MKNTLKTSLCVLTLLTACGGGGSGSSISSFIPETSLPDISNYEAIDATDATPLHTLKKDAKQNTGVWFDDDNQLVNAYEDDEDELIVDKYGNFKKGSDNLIYAKQTNPKADKTAKYAVLVKSGDKWFATDMKTDSLEELQKEGFDTAKIGQEQQFYDEEEKRNFTVKIVENIAGKFDSMITLGGYREGLKYADFGIITDITTYTGPINQTAKEINQFLAVADTSKFQPIKEETQFKGHVLGGVNNYMTSSALELDGTLDLTMTADNKSSLTATFDNWYTVKVEDMNTVSLSDENKVADGWKYKDVSSITDLKEGHIMPLGNDKVEEVVGEFRLNTVLSANDEDLEAHFSFGGKVVPAQQ